MIFGKGVNILDLKNNSYVICRRRLMNEIFLGYINICVKKTIPIVKFTVSKVFFLS